MEEEKMCVIIIMFNSIINYKIKVYSTIDFGGGTYAIDLPSF